MNKKLYFICFSVFLSACAQSSSVLKMGPDTYTVSIHAAPVRGGETGAKSLAIKEASQYCLSENKQFLLKNMNARPSSHLPGGTADIIFRCLNENDPEYLRPNYSRSPDILIEER